MTWISTTDPGNDADRMLLNLSFVSQIRVEEDRDLGRFQLVALPFQPIVGPSAAAWQPAVLATFTRRGDADGALNTLIESLSAVDAVIRLEPGDSATLA